MIITVRDLKMEYQGLRRSARLQCRKDGKHGSVYTSCPISIKYEAWTQMSAKEKKVCIRLVEHALHLKAINRMVDTLDKRVFYFTKLDLIVGMMSDIVNNMGLFMKSTSDPEKLNTMFMKKGQHLLFELNTPVLTARTRSEHRLVEHARVIFKALMAGF